MKKITWLFVGLMLIVPLFFVHPVSAVTPAGVKVTATPLPTVTPTPGPVEYVLPYPGILPTHPMYFFKTLRDRIIEMLIADPLSKGEFYILQADKKLNMGLSLKNLGKTNEAKTAFAESLASRTQAVSVLEAHMKAGSTIPGHITEKFNLSLDKHAEVLRAAGESTDAVVALRARVAKLLLEVK